MGRGVLSGEATRNSIGKEALKLIGAARKVYVCRNHVRNVELGRSQSRRKHTSILQSWDEWPTCWTWHSFVLTINVYSLDPTGNGHPPSSRQAASHGIAQSTPRGSATTVTSDCITNGLNPLVFDCDPASMGEREKIALCEDLEDDGDLEGFCCPVGASAKKKRLVSADFTRYCETEIQKAIDGKRSNYLYTPANGGNNQTGQLSKIERDEVCTGVSCRTPPSRALFAPQ